jgi:predicted nucleic acid-binding protein
MCIVIDACCFSPVFSKKDDEHKEFRPVLDWIIKGKGKMVYGGSKYKKELKKAPKYLRVIMELKKAGKIAPINDSKKFDWIVDKNQKELENKVQHKDFDDAHIVAIIISSKCRLICTNDKRAIPFFKESSFYPKGVKKPKLYTGSKNSDLLNDKLIAEVCMPAKKGTRDLSNAFSL